MRNLYYLLLLTLPLLFSAPLLNSEEPEKPSGPQRNVIFLFTDDQKADLIGALGRPDLKTPHMDRLVETGYTFTQAYCMGSLRPNVCLPSRTQVLTGKNMFNAVDKKTTARQPSFPRRMSQAGYRTMRSGKKGSTPGALTNEFEQNTSERREVEVEIAHVDRAIEFVQAEDDRPFFIYLAFGAPHDPQQASREFQEMYTPETVPLPDAFLPLHPFDNGEMMVRDEKTLPWPRTPERVREKMAKYYASISFIDHQVGRLLKALEEEGLLEKTLIVLSSDNGLAMGDHGLLGKQNLYEFGGMQVPLVFMGPEIPQGKTAALAYLHDIYPTICELVGIEVPEHLDGQSLAPIIRGETEAVRDEMFTAYRDVQRAIRDDRWKLIRYPKIGETQLFDLQNDPMEQNNLAEAPEHASKVKEMMKRLRAAMDQLDDEAPLEVDDPAPKRWSPPME